MINKFFIIGFSLFVISSCINNSKLSLVTGIIKEISVVNDCPISFEIVENKTSELILNFECDDNQDGVKYGYLLLEVYSRLDIQKATFEKYSVKRKGEIIFDLTLKEMQEIKKLRILFENNVTLLKDKDYTQFYNRFGNEIKEMYSKAELTKNFDKLLASEYYFQGFTVSSFKGEKYVLFKSINKNQYIILSFKLNGNSDNIIYAIELV